MYSLSERIKTLPISSVRKLTPFATQARKEGVKVYHLNIGDPDIKTPKVMLDVLRNWDMETIRYAGSSGEQNFLEALESYYKGLGFEIRKEDLVVAVGGSEALMMAFFATCNTGDEILVFEPFYSNYASIAHFCGVKLVAVPTSIDNGFHLSRKAEIEKKITKKTKAILFCSPGNPTGAIYSKKELEMLVEIAKKHNLFLISDEVYREFAFDKKSHVSILEFLDKIPNQIILVDSLSKRYSLCGARIGILASKNMELVVAVIKVAQGRLSAGLIEQQMASKLTKVPKSYTKSVISKYQKRRDFIFESLSKIPGIFIKKPEGAFYAVVSLPVKNAEDFCIFLLKEFRLKNSTLMLAPAAGFYQTPNKGLNQVRIAYVLNTKDLKVCMEIIEKGLVAYKEREGFA